MEPQGKAMPWWVVPGLAAIGMATFGGAVIGSAFVGDSTLRTTMFTATVTIAAGIVAFYFGSSASSQKKDEIIANSVPAPGSMVTTAVVQASEEPKP